MFFYRDPEEVEREQAEAAAAKAAAAEEAAAPEAAAADWDASVPAQVNVQPAATENIDWSADAPAGDWSEEAAAQPTPADAANGGW